MNNIGCAAEDTKLVIGLMVGADTKLVAGLMFGADADTELVVGLMFGISNVDVNIDGEVVEDCKGVFENVEEMMGGRN